jgi:hypothetical protein
MSKFSKDLKTDGLQLKRMGFEKHGMDEYHHAGITAKGWIVRYVEALKGFYICQQFNGCSFANADLVVNIVKFSEILNVKLFYNENIDCL